MTGTAMSTVPLEETGLTLANERAEQAARCGMQQIEEHPDWPVLSRLPMRLTAEIPLPRFKVRDLLGLRSGQVIASLWPSTEDVPLKLGAVTLSWSEFEVVESRMAVRLTRLA